MRRESIVVVHLLGLNKLYTLFECFYGRFSKQVNVRCDISSIFMLIASYIHNAANYAITKNSWQSCFKIFEVPFSSKQRGAIRTDWKTYFCISYHLCIVVSIFQGATSLSIFQKATSFSIFSRGYTSLSIFQEAISLSICSTTRPSLAQYRKLMKSNYIFNYGNWNINLMNGFGNQV